MSVEYHDTELGLRIYFKCEEMDLRDLGIVAAALHKAFNAGFFQGLDLPRLYGLRRYHYEADDPLVISLVVKNLEYGSLSADVKAKVHRVIRDLSIGVAGSLIASTIWAVGESARGAAAVEMPQERPAQYRPVDVGNNVRDMVERLSATDKEWELTIEDKTTGTKITIRSGK